MINEVIRILESVHWPKSLAVNDQLIDAIEKRMKFRLPDDYRYFLINYSGYDTFLKQMYFVLWDSAVLERLNDSYEIQHYLPTTLAIGSNGGGEMIGLHQSKDGKVEIVLSPLGSLKDIEHRIVIGDSFTDFLIRMDNNERWFKV